MSAIFHAIDKNDVHFYCIYMHDGLNEKKTKKEGTKLNFDFRKKKCNYKLYLFRHFHPLFCTFM